MSQKTKFILHRELIEQCRRSDENAQFRVYELYFKAIYNTSLRLVGEAAIAEEIMQDSFLSAFNKIEQYEGKVAFGAWLKKIAVNKSLDYLKKQRVNFTSFDDKIVPELADENIDFEDNEAIIDQIREKIEQLPEGFRIVLSLYLLEGYSHEEIAELLNIKASSSRSQLARAKKKLKQELLNLNLNGYEKFRRYNS